MPQMTFIEKTGAVVLIVLMFASIFCYHWMMDRTRRRGAGASRRRREDHDKAAR
jgi:hypothetical protein